MIHPFVTPAPPDPHQRRWLGTFAIILLGVIIGILAVSLWVSIAPPPEVRP